METLGRRGEARGWMPEGARPDVPWSTYVLIAANVVVFLLGTFAQGFGRDAGFVFSRGSLYAPVLFKGRELHRLFTSMFLHADAGHLINNMIVLFAGGGIVERNLGHVRFIALYIVSGLAGNAASVFTEYLTRSYSFSIGASGAVFGVIGALVFLILMEARRGSGREAVRREGAGPHDVRRGSGRGAARREGSGGAEIRYVGRGSDAMYPDAIYIEETMEETEGGDASSGKNGLTPSMKSLLVRTGLMTAYLLYSGWSNPSVNQAAHVGGIAGGFLLGAVLMPRGRRGADLSGLLGMAEKQGFDEE